VNYVGDEQQQASESDEQCEYAFTVNPEPEKVSVNVGGVDLGMMIDSGSTVNIVDSQTWESLKQQEIRCISRMKRASDHDIFPYGSEKPLPVKGYFKCDLKLNGITSEAEFVVLQGKGIPLLSKATARQHKVLHVGVAAISSAQNFVQKYPKAFSGVGKLKDRRIQIHIRPDVTPVAQHLRRTPFHLRKKVEDKISELIKMDIIEPVEGPTPWVNPVVIVPKPDGEIRLCIDMRRANEAIERVRHPIPTTDEILHSMNGSTVFSKLDLRWGYHQIELEEDSRGITTFVTHAGLYRYKRLLFGVNSASEQYQHEIQRVLSGLEGAANISDDIIVHGRGTEAHDRNMEAVMNRLVQSGLTLNPEKCQFNMSKITFMGMLVSEKGIGPTEERVKAVVEAREPTTASEVHSFLGLVNFSGRFIPDLATISDPLRQLTKKNVPFTFGDEERRAFNRLKEALAEAGTLAYFDSERPTRVITDASPIGLGAVLVQKQGDEWVAVSYASRSLTDCERRYSQTEKEALAVVWGCEKFHHYILGSTFELITDHKPLETIYGPRSRPSARIERWVLRLQPYCFRVLYAPGRQNIADALSRLTAAKEGKPVHNHGAEEYVHFVSQSAVPNALTMEELEAESLKDEELIHLRECLQTEQYHKCDRNYRLVVQELCIAGTLILRGTRIIISVKLRPRVLALAHEGHLGIVATKQRLRSNVWWPGMDAEVERHCRACHGCQLVAKADAPEPIRSTPLPPCPWQDLAVDLMGPLPLGHSLLGRGLLQSLL